MCIIAVSYRQHPDYPLLLVANRDEFFQRPTAAADWWADSPGLLAGRDLQAGGSWLGVTRGGRVAALTNFRDPAALKPDAPSRGELVSNFLRGAQAAPEFAAALLPQLPAYNGFNLLLFDGERLSYVSSTESRIVTLQPGLYVVSNHVLDTPWPKVERLKQGLRAQLAECNLDEAVLFALLADQETPPDAHLPDTGVGLEWERRLASIFVRAPGYGTRASTLLRLQRHRAELVERSFDADGNSAGERRFHFPLQPAPQA